MLALLGALREEISDIKKSMAIEKVAAGSDHNLYQGKFKNRDILLVETGMGQQRTEAATRFILQNYAVTALISLGFAGSLNSELEVGDVVVCSTLHYANERMQKAKKSETFHSDTRLLSLATSVMEDARIRIHCGSSITAAQLISSPEAKEKLGELFGTDVVDMESYWVAKIASASEIPFITIRAVSDAKREHLPPFNEMLTADGGWLRKKIFFYIVLHPQSLRKIFCLYRRARRARQNLTTCISNVVANME